MSKATKGLDPSSSKKTTSKLSVAGVAPNTAIPAPSQSKTKPSINKTKQIVIHPLEVMLGPTVKHSNGTTVSPKTFAVENGVIGLYFAAHWCPPCKMLTAQLALLYDELKKKDQKFEVVYISFDYSEESFDQYFSKMPWCAIAYSDTDKREKVAEDFDIRRIPTLILLDAMTYVVITQSGREVLMLDPLGEMFPWKMVIPHDLTSPEVLSVHEEEVEKPKSQIEVGNKAAEPEDKIVELSSSNTVTVNKQ